jgi:acetyl esterase
MIRVMHDSSIFGARTGPRDGAVDERAGGVGAHGGAYGDARGGAFTYTDAESFARRWARRVVTLLASVTTLLVFVIVLGAIVQSLGWVSVIGTLVESFFTLHIFLAGLVAIGLAFAALSLGGRLATTVVLWLAIASTAGALVPIGALVGAASRLGARISWTDHLAVTAPGPLAEPNQTQLFASVGGKELFADVYLPAGGASAANPSAPVVMIHGGGFSGGVRSDGRDWDRWLAARGYTVFDVDYRLDPPVTGYLAAQDVACAMSWIGDHASEYNISPERMLVAGQSAGAGLAMQVGYGLGDGTVVSSCGGAVPQPAAVFALYPPDDFALGWDLNTGFGRISARNFNTGYIGGAPEIFPERYRAVSPIFHVRAGLPPTLIAAGAHDHLVPFGGHVEMVEKLNAAGVPVELVSVPFGEHAFDIAWGSLGGQITREALADFLARYLPARVGR